jgi:hypothetical protein
MWRSSYLEAVQNEARGTSGGMRPMIRPGDDPACLRAALPEIETANNKLALPPSSRVVSPFVSFAFTFRLRFEANFEYADGHQTRQKTNVSVRE